MEEGVVVGKEWEKEFWKMFISTQKGDLRKALDLKRKYIPEKLYRYRSLDNLDYVTGEILTGEIYVASPIELNDIFDATSLMSSKDPKFYFSNENIKEIYEDSFKELPADVFEKIFNNKDWYDKLAEYVAENVIYGTDLTIAEAKSKLYEIEMNMLEEINESFNGISYTTTRIACFTDKETNIPMWAHYAKDHTGVCIEYATETIKNELTLNSLYPIKYTEELLDGMSHIMDRLSNPLSANSFLEELATQKHKDWEYEQEWRLLLRMGHLYPSAESIPKEYQNKGQLYYFTKPAKVILGCKISEQNEILLRDVCKNAGVDVAKMKITPYGLMY